MSSLEDLCSVKRRFNNKKKTKKLNRDVYLTSCLRQDIVHPVLSTLSLMVSNMVMTMTSKCGHITEVTSCVS